MAHSTGAERFTGFTQTAASMVARNDRRQWFRQLVVHFRPAAARALLAWSALVVAAFVLVLLPLNMRMA